MIDSYINRYKGKKIGFVGLGISNMPILRLFTGQGIDISVRDVKDPSAGEYGEYLKSIGARLITGDGYLDGIDEDVLFLSPAIKQFLPQLVRAKENGVYITTEMQEFFKLCPCKTIGVTGSDGKTTTTTLIAKLLEAAGKKVHLGGNIGSNLFAKLDEIEDGDFAVAELSSFQLMKMSLSPDIAVITNLAPNHLDWHKNMQEYIDAKKNIFLHQSAEGKTVLNASNEQTAALSKLCPGKVVTFGVGVGDFRIWADGIYKGEELILADGDILLPGAHNRQNYAAALAALDGIVTPSQAADVAKSFGGVEHRIERVRVKDGVTYYNSSIDSSPSRTMAALNSFDTKLIVIAGGYDKNIPLDPLGELFNKKVKVAVLMGDTAPKIKAVLVAHGFGGRIIDADNMEQAVKAAQAAARSGDIVILSPAAASFDKYKNFMCRGEDFKNKVNSL